MSASESLLPRPAATVPRLLKGRVLRGCNVHHRETVYTQPVDLGALAGRRTGEAGPEFASRFLERFSNPPSPEAPFERALLEAILAVEHAVARTMRRLDTPGFATIVRDTSSPGVVTLVWECHAGSLSRGAARVALAGLLDLWPDRQPPEDFAALRRRLQRRARRRQWSTATAALALASKRRGVPCEPLAGAYLRLGEGALQRVVSEAVGGDDPAAALESFFPAALSARLPTALIVGESGAGALARELDGLLRTSGGAVGLVTPRETTIGGRPVDPASHGRGDGARFLLGDPRLERLVCTASPRRIVERGLRVDHATAIAILEPRIGGDADAFRRGIDVAVSATTGDVVLAADHPHVERLARDLGARRLVLVSSRRPSAKLRRHLAEGGSAVFVTSLGTTRAIELRRSDVTIAAVSTSALRRATTPPGARRIRTAAFAMALAAGLGLSGDEIAAAVAKRRFLRR